VRCGVHVLVDIVIDIASVVAIDVMYAVDGVGVGDIYAIVGVDVVYVVVVVVVVDDDASVDYVVVVVYDVVTVDGVGCVVLSYMMLFMIARLSTLVLMRMPSLLVGMLSFC